MPTRSSFEYAVIRVVPRVEREEFLNAGVVVFCLEKRFLSARVWVDAERLLALWPHTDLDVVQRHLDAIPAICAGREDGGTIAAMPIRERFHWLVSARSTMIQTSPVHAGLCESPERELEKLFSEFVGAREPRPQRL